LRSAAADFRAAGANMGQALADGLNSKAGEVEAAAQRLANAAAAAVRAAAGIRSPSRVFIELGEMLSRGLALGIGKSETEAEKAARSLADAVIAQASRLEEAFANDQWAVEFDARVRQELAQHDTPATAGGGKGQVVITQNFNVPSSERASDKALHGMRRLSAFGLFDG
jgi:hypothetical protein